MPCSIMILIQLVRQVFSVHHSTWFNEGHFEGHAQSPCMYVCAHLPWT